MTRLKLAFDMLPGLQAGSGRHQQRTLEELARHIGTKVAQITALAFGTRFPRPNDLPAPIGWARCPLPGRVQVATTKALRICAEQLVRIDADVVYSTRMWHFRARAPLVVNIFDVSWRQFCGQYRTTFNARQIRAAEEAISRAAHITTCSQATANELRSGGVPDERISVIPLGVDERFAQGVVATNRVRATHSLPDRFVLYIGGINERKNLRVLAHAMERLEPRVPLVLAGPIPAEPLGYWGLDRPWMRHLGYVPETDIPGLYAAATVKVFPSKLEGFGLPLIEAMAAGTPVLAADIPVFREVGGDAACFFPPDDASELERLISTALESRDFCEEYRGRGRTRAATLTWTAYGEALIGVLHRVAQQSGRAA